MLGLAEVTIKNCKLIEGREKWNSKHAYHNLIQLNYHYTLNTYRSAVIKNLACNDILKAKPQEFQRF